MWFDFLSCPPLLVPLLLLILLVCDTQVDMTDYVLVIHNKQPDLYDRIVDSPISDGNFSLIFSRSTDSAMPFDYICTTNLCESDVKTIVSLFLREYFGLSDNEYHLIKAIGVR